MKNRQNTSPNAIYAQLISFDFQRFFSIALHKQTHEPQFNFIYEMILSDNHWIISGFPDFNTFKITFWEFCNAFTYSQNYSLWQFHLNFEMEKEKMSRFGQGGFSYMRRPLDPGLFSFGCILSKEMSLFQSLSYLQWDLTK